MKSLKFYDLKEKKSFYTDDYAIKNIKGRKFAIAETKSGGQSYRICA